MKMKKKPSKSIRKYIRNKKAFIRKETLNEEKQKELINSLYESLQNKKVNK